MNMQANTFARVAAVVAGAFALAACATGPEAPEQPIEPRVKLNALQSDSQLATRAPVETQEAEEAVRLAEEADLETERGQHLLLMANQKVETARARAQSRLYQDQRQNLSQERERARLQARTLEAERAQREAEMAQQEAAMAQQEVAMSREQQAELQRQIEELNARETERGIVVTLGDVLFAFGEAELMGAAIPNLNKLAAFLQEYPDRDLHIEGHTDSVGGDEFNQRLSERRAQSVRSYLVQQGIDTRRITTAGMGQTSPVASNETQSGRAQNRRVEVIISNDESQVTERALSPDR
jgi:outer membrane protein OmpA-like peptidoglycan-associated protein